MFRMLFFTYIIGQSQSFPSIWWSNAHLGTASRHIFERLRPFSTSFLIMQVLLTWVRQRHSACFAIALGGALVIYSTYIHAHPSEIPVVESSTLYHCDSVISPTIAITSCHDVTEHTIT